MVHEQIHIKADAASIREKKGVIDFKSVVWAPLFLEGNLSSLGFEVVLSFVERIVPWRISFGTPPCFDSMNLVSISFFPRQGFFTAAVASWKNRGEWLGGLCWGTREYWTNYCVICENKPSIGWCWLIDVWLVIPQHLCMVYLPTLIP